jgi:hypothetical protein
MKKQVITFGLSLFWFFAIGQSNTNELKLYAGKSSEQYVYYKGISLDPSFNLSLTKKFPTFNLNQDIENKFILYKPSALNIFQDTLPDSHLASRNKTFKNIAISTLSSILIVPTLLDTTGTHLVLTMGSIYGFSIVGQKYLCKASDKIPIPVWPKYLLYAYGSGMLLENFVTIDNRKLPLSEREKVQFHPNRNKDLLIGLGFYAPFALGGTWLANKYNFSHTEIFIMTAVSGILIEQQGRIFSSFNPAAWLGTSIPYGSFQALPALLTNNELNNKDRKKIKVGKKMLLMLGVQTGAIICGTLLGQTIKNVIK